MKRNKPGEALEKMRKVCSMQEKCSRDVRMKLAGWGVKNEEIETILEILQRELFVDDARFSRLYAMEKFRINKWGKIKIAVALKQKHLPGELIESALDQIDEESYFNLLLQEIRKKRKGTRALNQYDLRGKLYRFAQGRGFESDLIYRAIEQCIREGR